MAVFNGKEGRWVTTKDGKHVFIEGAEDPVEKQERDIKEQEERTKSLNAQNRIEDTTEDKLYRALSISKYTDDVPEDLVREYRELQSKLDTLYKELEPETIKDDDPEIRSLGILADLFDTYTERGEEIRKQIAEVQKQKKVVDAKIKGYGDVFKKFEKYQYAKELSAWEKNKPQLKKISAKDYMGFSLEPHTGMVEDALEKGDAIIVEMSPKEYLQRISYDIFKASLQQTLRGVLTDNVQKYARQMKQGVKFDLPWIDLKNSGQEGRHRALAAILNGYDKIPVAVRIR